MLLTKEFYVSIFQFLKYYSNGIVTIIAAIFYVAFSGETSEPSGLSTDYAYVIGTIIFAILAVWVFSLGALVTLVQLIYGLAKYFLAKEKELANLYHCVGAAIAILGYVIIFSVSATSA